MMHAITLDFGEALHALVQGHVVTRKAWAVQGTTLRLTVADDRRILRWQRADGTTGKWRAKQSDLFADDWVLVPEGAVEW